MAKPSNYPNSLQTVSERIPTRFRKHVRHFLAALDRLNTDFEVHCALYRAGELQPLRLIYTEESAQSQDTNSADDGVTGGETAAVIDSTTLEVGGDAEQHTDSSIGSPALVRAAEAAPPSPMGAPPCLRPSEFSPATHADWQAETWEDSGYPLSLTDPTWDAPVAAPVKAMASSQPQADWERGFASELTATLDIARRPPTLTEILQGTYGEHRETVQRTEAELLLETCRDTPPNPDPHPPAQLPAEPIRAALTARLIQTTPPLGCPPAESVVAVTPPLAAPSLSLLAPADTSTDSAAETPRLTAVTSEPVEGGDTLNDLPPLPDNDPHPTPSTAASEAERLVLPSPPATSAIVSAAASSAVTLPSPVVAATDHGRAATGADSEVALPSPSEVKPTLVDEPSATGDRASDLSDHCAVVLPTATGDSGVDRLVVPAATGDGAPVLNGSAATPTLPTDAAGALSLEAALNGSTAQSPALPSPPVALLPAPLWEGATSQPLEPAADRVALPSATGLAGSTTPPLLTAERVALPSGTVLDAALETGGETASPLVEAPDDRGDVLPLEGREGTSSLLQQAVIEGFTGAGADQTLLQAENAALLSVEGGKNATETHSETATETSTCPALEANDEPLSEALSSSVAPALGTADPLDSGQQTDNLPHSMPPSIVGALSIQLGIEQQAEARCAEPDRESLTSNPSALAVSATSDPSPISLEESPSTTGETPDQGFAEDLFVVWRRVALTQSPTVWGVVVSLEDIFTQGFSTWFAPRFIGCLAASEGVIVTWGCAVQLVNESYELHQERERYQVGSKTVTGVTFQNPNVRVLALEPSVNGASLKALAQSPLPALMATAVETTDPDLHDITAHSAADTLPLAEAVPTAPQGEGGTSASSSPKLGSRWRAGLRALLGWSG